MRFNFFLTLASVMVLLLAEMKKADAQMTVAQPIQTKVETESGIRFFEGTWEEALVESKKTGKPIFMDCYTVWCVPCKMLAKDVFTRPEVGDYFNIHFINVKMDMGTEQGKVLNDKYQVTGYPTLLFLDGDGNLIHRIVGAPTADILLKEGGRAIDGKGYSSMSKAYEEGNRQPNFIQEYMDVLDIAGEGSKAAQICLNYFKTLDKSKLKEREYWELFCKYVKDVDADVSKYVYKNRAEFINLFGAAAVEKKLFQLFSNGAYRYWKKEGDSGIFDEKGFENYVHQLMKKDIRGKEQIIMDARMAYAMNTGDWAKYVQMGTDRLNDGEKSDFVVYNWALRVNMQCNDTELREKAAEWMDRMAIDCDRRPQSDATISLKKSFLRVADQLRHPEKKDKNYRPTITISGKIAALTDNDNTIKIIKKDGFFKQTVDSCEAKLDGTYELKMKVEKPGMYILECQGGQKVDFWAGTEDLKVDFPGFGKAKMRVIRPMYIHIQGGKDNEVINQMNWEIYQNYQLMGSISRPVYNYSGLVDSVKQQIASQLTDVAGKIVLDRLQHYAEVYADREAVLAILMLLKGEEYEETVKKVVDNLSKLYPGSLALKDFKAVLAQRELAKQGQMAPEFSCPTPDGKKNFGPQDFKGKFLVMDFWASWCGPCRAEIPHLKKAYEKYADKEVAFFSVSIDKSNAAWKKALGEENMPWEQVCAPQAGKEVMRLYQFSGIPYVLILDKEGRIVGTNLRGQALMDKLEELVNGKKTKAAKSSMMMVR